MRPARVMAAAMALSATLVTGAAPAEPCAMSAASFQVVNGALSEGLACGTFFLATDGWSGPFSRGDVSYAKPVAVPFAMEVTWQRLGSDGGESLSLGLRGGILLLRRGEYGFYAFSQSFQWNPLPGFSTLRESTVRVEQRAKEIVLFVDGRRVGVLPFVAPAGSGEVGVGLKGMSGYRSRMRFRDFSVISLEQAPSASPARSK